MIFGGNRQEKFLRPFRRTFKEEPAITWACSQQIQIPTEATRFTLLLCCHCETSALRERCCLKANSETPKIVRCPFIQRVNLTQPHRSVQLFRTHPLSVIKYGYRAGCPIK